MNTERICKVYLHILPKEISHHTNDMYYVGITSKPVSKRWRNGEGYRNNRHFYSAIKKYGWDNFKHIILEDNLTVEEANNREQDYIAKYNSFNSQYGYNHTEGGGGILGYKRTEEQIARVSGANNYLAIKVFQFDLMYNFVAKFNAVTEAEKEVGVKGIENRILQRSVGANSLWARESDVIEIGDSYELIDRLHFYRFGEELHDLQIHNIFVFKDDMFVALCVGTNTASQYSGESKGAIENSLRTYSTTLKGYTFRRQSDISESEDILPKYPKSVTLKNLELCHSVIDNQNIWWFKKNKEKSFVIDKDNDKRIKPIIQYTLDGQFVAKYDMVKEATKKTGINSTSIINVCKHKYSTAGGYKWEYK